MRCFVKNLNKVLSDNACVPSRSVDPDKIVDINFHVAVPVYALKVATIHEHGAASPEDRPFAQPYYGLNHCNK